MLFSRFSRQDSTLHVMLCSAFIFKFIIAVAALAVAGIIIIIITRTFEVKHFKNLREANRHNFCSHQNVNKIFAATVCSTIQSFRGADKENDLSFHCSNALSTFEKCFANALAQFLNDFQRISVSFGNIPNVLKRIEKVFQCNCRRFQRCVEMTEMTRMH